jgi:hypothetical protein
VVHQDRHPLRFSIHECFTVRTVRIRSTVLPPIVVSRIVTGFERRVHPGSGDLEIQRRTERLARRIRGGDHFASGPISGLGTFLANVRARPSLDFAGVKGLAARFLKADQPRKHGPDSGRDVQRAIWDIREHLTAKGPLRRACPWRAGARGEADRPHWVSTGTEVLSNDEGPRYSADPSLWQMLTDAADGEAKAANHGRQRRRKLKALTRLVAGELAMNCPAFDEIAPRPDGQLVDRLAQLIEGAFVDAIGRTRAIGRTPRRQAPPVALLQALAAEALDASPSTIRRWRRRASFA